MTKSRISRRTFIGSATAGGVLAASGRGADKADKIDRYALVSRHNPVLRKFEPLSPLSVGNGEFAFTCDVTGLQTFPELYNDAMPLCTMSQWGWHTKPLPEHLKGKELKLTDYDTYGRKVGYMTTKTGQEELFDWLRENPHRLHLGRVGFRFVKSDGTEGKPSDITNIEQKLDLWTGTITSQFRIENVPVQVKTAVHPLRDLLAVRVQADPAATLDFSVIISFPYGSPSMQAANWELTEKHGTYLAGRSAGAVLTRRLDNDQYFADVNWPDYSATIERFGLHEFQIKPKISSLLDFSIEFSRMTVKLKPPTPAAILSTTEEFWQGFWNGGAAIDFSGSKDPRAVELERRVVLSQYLTAINCSGSTPPQETGLTTNSWYGKFHLEMHWWHAAQFALWNRYPLLDRSLDWYNKILPSAKERARQQGYKGARWPKMTDTSGRDSPSPVGTLLIWQQPHPIFYCELAYLHRPTKATLARFKAVVEETATWMADYAHYDKEKDRYVLGPPAIPAQENHPARETWNPTYELEYWRFGLKTAQKWRERLGLPRNKDWDTIIAKLSKLPAGSPGDAKAAQKPKATDPGTDAIMAAQEKYDASANKSERSAAEKFDPAAAVYWAHENAPQSFTERNHDHPSMLAALGILTGEMADRETMRRTLKKVMEVWDWPSTWGWDYPMVAMTAARVGEQATAIDALLIDTPKNRYAANGHNYQRPNLPLYLPGNGGLLYAIALMANGWKGAPEIHAPGFPQDGSWKVKAEGFNAAIFRQI